MSKRQSSSRLSSVEPAGMFHTEDNRTMHLFEQARGELLIRLVIENNEKDEQPVRLYSSRKV